VTTEQSPLNTAVPHRCWRLPAPHIHLWLLTSVIKTHAFCVLCEHVNCNSQGDSQGDSAGVKRLLIWYILVVNSEVEHQNVQQQCEGADDRRPAVDENNTCTRGKTLNMQVSRDAARIFDWGSPGHLVLYHPRIKAGVLNYSCLQPARCTLHPQGSERRSNGCKIASYSMQ